MGSNPVGVTTLARLVREPGLFLSANRGTTGRRERNHLRRVSTGLSARGFLTARGVSMRKLNLTFVLCSLAAACGGGSNGSANARSAALEAASVIAQSGVQ